MKFSEFSEKYFTVVPENSLIDLKSFRLVMDEVVGQTGADALATTQIMSILPAAEDLLYSVQTFCGGVALDNGTPEMNTANRIKNLCEETQTKADSCASLTDGALSTLEAPHVVTGPPVVQPVDNRSMSAKFRGLIGGESSCRYLNSALSGSLQVQIQTAGAEVCMLSQPSPAYSAGNTYAAALPTKHYPNEVVTLGTSAQKGYTITQYHFVVDCLSLANGFYEAMLRQRIQESGFVSINYSAYNVFLNSLGVASQGAAKFSLSAASIDKLFGTLRTSDYNDGLVAPASYGAISLNRTQFPPNQPPNDQQPARAIVQAQVQPAAGGSSLTTGTTWNWNPDLPNSMQQIPKFFKFSNYGNCAPDNPSAGIDGVLPATQIANPFTSQWTINSVRHPQVPANELANAVKSNLYSEQEAKKTSGNAVGSLAAYRYVGFVDTQRLNFPTNLDTDSACVLKSGYSSRGVAAQLVWSVAGVNAGTGAPSRQMVIVVQSTSELRIGAGRQLSVVF